MPVLVSKYRCLKCNKLFDTYDDAILCETSHKLRFKLGDKVKHAELVAQDPFYNKPLLVASGIWKILDIDYENNTYDLELVDSDTSILPGFILVDVDIMEIQRDN